MVRVSRWLEIVLASSISRHSSGSGVFGSKAVDDMSRLLPLVRAAFSLFPFLHSNLLYPHSFSHCGHLATVAHDLMKTN